MKILFVNANIVSGGAEKMLVWLANNMAKDNEVTFLTYRDDCCSKDFFQLDGGIRRIKICTEKRGAQVGETLLTIKKIHNLLRAEQYDVAIAFLSPSQLRLAVARIGTNTKLLFSQRGDPYQMGVTSWVHKLNSMAFNSADFYVFQTERARDYYSKKIKNNSCVIANPIKPLQRTMDRTADKIEKKIVTVSRLDIHQKRQDVLIAAFKLFNKIHPNYTLHFFGDGPDRGQLEALASDNSNIVFEGETSNVAEAIQNATIFVLTSDFEGIPNALLEAMSLGLPCISTDCSPGGAVLLIQSGENGYITDCGDAEALSEKMNELVVDFKKAETFGTNAMYVCEAFSERSIKEKWQDVIQSMKYKYI